MTLLLECFMVPSPSPPRESVAREVRPQHARASPPRQPIGVPVAQLFREESRETERAKSKRKDSSRLGRSTHVAPVHKPRPSLSCAQRGDYASPTGPSRRLTHRAAESDRDVRRLPPLR